MAGSEEIDADGRASEVLFLGLRRVEGVNAAFFRDMTGCDLGVRFGEQIARGTDGGLLSWDGERVALTDRGTLLCNEAVAPFLGP
jgi:oxygen-independent coproporphyrinogen-3 oxidase